MRARELTTPHLDILAIPHQAFHSWIQVRESRHKLIWRSTNTPAIVAQIIDRSRIEAVAANDLAITAGGHHDFVNSKTAPIFNRFV